MHTSQQRLGLRGLSGQRAPRARCSVDLGHAAIRPPKPKDFGETPILEIAAAAIASEGDFFRTARKCAAIFVSAFLSQSFDESFLNLVALSTFARALLERRRARPDEYFLRLGSPICLYYRAITRAAELVFPFFANR
jgi:hypothetical protein